MIGLNVAIFSTTVPLNNFEQLKLLKNQTYISNRFTQTYATNC